MKYVFLMICLMVPLMGAECSSPDGSHRETFQSNSGSAAPVPEPSSVLIMAVGMVIVAAYLRLRK